MTRNGNFTRRQAQGRKRGRDENWHD